jgi:putative glutamine amidotransferase
MVLRAMYDRLDGILLPGGEDIDPARYDEPVHPGCGRVTPERDQQELALARWAVDDGRPLLAICRGIQVLNVALGGSLYQDISAQLPLAGRHAHLPGQPRGHPAHQVSIHSQTRLACILGVGELWVNSMHHQAIKELAPRLAITACAPDGVVEGAEVGDHPFAVAVQWHPEEMTTGNPLQQRLFDAFVDACRV